ncbi:alpha/beta hydrolase [Mycolicibacterium mengxianglii]|uniref:alpha/beta hydrolase n=1 Tax=Mycolicibacterium mengxianglii TaxID=2736649 RepID=UPI0018D03E33|nr:alpha/beta hydrolase [Mycolicibacterium mengxianglii]
MTRISAWMGAGAVAAGVSAALIAGADVASADTGADTAKSDTPSTSSSETNDRSTSRGSDETSADTADTDASDDTTDTDDTDDTDTDDTDSTEETGLGDEADSDEEAVTDETDTGSAGSPQPEVADGHGSGSALEQGAIVDEPAVDPEVVPVADVDEAPAEIVADDPEPVPAESEEGQANSPDRAQVNEQAPPSATASKTRVVSAVLSSATVAAAPAAPSLADMIQSFVFDVIGVAVTFVAGPPVVPAGSKVTVRSSSLEITEGRTVPADWYYPEGDVAPERIILLQHGFLGVSAMYSYTAAYLAERTNSIVVVPTYSSNRYVRDGFWLGDDQVYRATAELFLGDRGALTASAVAAGYAQKYGAGVPLPQDFVLIGHSLGAGVVSGAAGYYADAVVSSGEDNHLAGVILLDGAPPANVLPDALDKLDGLGSYIPVLELGAPKETRRVDAALNGHRPGKFNGVVLTDGKHLDSMMGGSPLIQLISHLYQGFPTPQNQLAAQTLIAGWTNDIFAGRIDPSTGKCEGAGCAGIYGDLGQTIPLQTTDGPTSAVVIGNPGPARLLDFQPMTATSVVVPTPPGGKGLRIRV